MHLSNSTGMTVGSLLLALSIGCPQSQVISTCQVITHDLTHRPHISVQDSEKLKNSNPEDDYDDLDESLSHLPAEYELTLEFGGPGGGKINAVADTGSSNLIVQGANCSGCNGTTYKPSSNATSVGQHFSIAYGSGGSDRVNEYNDLVGFVCGDHLPFTFGVMSQNTNLPNIIGLGYSSIAQPFADPLPPFLDMLVNNHKVANLFSMTLCGQKSGSQIILGDNNHAVDLSKLTYAPVLEESYYVLPFKSMRVKETNASLGNFPDYATTRTRTILDSGTTLNLIPQNIYSAILAAMLKANSSRALGIPNAFFQSTIPNQAEYTMIIAPSKISEFPTLQVEVGSVSGGSFWLDMPPDVYFKDLGGGNRIFGFRPSNGNPAFIFGQVLMENNYSVFDRARKQVGFGPLTGLCKS